MLQAAPGTGDTAGRGAIVQVSGWFEGLRAEDLEAGARACFEERRGVLVESWGLRDAGPEDRDLCDRLEIGERAVHDARRENADDPHDREDWIVVKAMTAAPGRPFLELLKAAG
jgi:hypothetical protein